MFSIRRRVFYYTLFAPLDKGEFAKVVPLCQGFPPLADNMRAQTRKGDASVFAEDRAKFGTSEFYGNTVINALFDLKGDLFAAHAKIGIFAGGRGKLGSHEFFDVPLERVKGKEFAFLIGQNVRTVSRRFFRFEADVAQSRIFRIAERAQSFVIGDDGKNQHFQLSFRFRAVLIIGRDYQLRIEFGCTEIDLLPFLFAKPLDTVPV